MNRDCKLLQQALVEVAGVVDRLDDGYQEHLRSCETCRAVVAEELALVRLLDEAAPPEDIALQEQILLTLAERRLRRRWLAAVPVAASLAFAFLGVTLLGGIPAGGLAASIPAWSGGGLVALIQSCGNFLTALAAAGGVLANLITMPWSVAAAAAGLSGMAGLIFLSRRWKYRPVWSARS
ncbi:MAG: hypothetical protein K8R59_05015 [Thermoanaerobaculales bacterium]|nr:hypothetical protein [Thermoanaerobaculales bacterium]